MAHQMASKMTLLCQEGVDGLFVTIPSDNVVPAIQKCQKLNVPVISVNSGASTAQKIGLKHHMSQMEHSAGNEAGKRLEESGMTYAVCLIYKAGNTGVQQRCAGFAEAAAASQGVTDLGIALVPRDNNAADIKALEDAVGQDGDWEGVGILNNGMDTVAAIAELKKSHPKLLAGTFDLSDYEPLNEDLFLFEIDQNPIVQGYTPIWLLTLLASTKQHLLNTFIESGPSFIENSPSDSLQQCMQNNFEVCPRPVDIVYEENLIGNGILILGYAVVGISWSLSLFSFMWILRNRKSNIVEASQPEFLVLICVGALISSSILVALSFQAGNSDDARLAGIGCKTAPLLYTVGWVFMFGSLCAKTYRMFKIMRNVKEDKQRVVSFRSMLTIVLTAMLVDLVIAVTWTTRNPMEGERDEGSITGVQVHRFCNASHGRTLVVGVPIGVAVGDAQSLHVILIGIIGVHDICGVSLLFFPKILFHSSTEDDELHPKEDAVILASLRKVSTSKFGEVMDILNEVAAPDADCQLTDRQRAQLRLCEDITATKKP